MRCSTGSPAAVAEVGGAPDAIGIGVPSQVEFATGTVLSSVNIPLEGVPLREELGKRFGMPVFVDNDANCAALAEAQLVPDPPAQHLVMLTLGTGVGGGIVIDGRIERGHTGLGAELGHVILDGETALAATEPGFPRPGSLEWICSGTGLERAATEAAGYPRCSGREAVKAGREGRRRDDARGVRALRPLARPGHRQRGEHLRARARGDRRRAVPGGGPVPRRPPARRRRATRCRRSGSAPP